ncbi:dihydrodipicolinate synthase family protein [Clostridium sp. AM58-1XD]|uniref:dihydrodipicolinate synthase family protein n=1 Tax=Clostridium sp. AM58-1XD TaxID=2292307 RepID=UPI000E54E7DE|nr:dihydrodipicolinate synthase family protein [Clostridium sp. AM58-1XD]RGY99601.1 dihydrodipicolinate synthase family protein [Clostridium sp. AM58-1XD]
MNKLKLKGVLPPVVTPFTEGGDVDYDAFVSNIEKWNETGLTGYLILGSNSETCYLSREEKLELIRLSAEHRSEGKHIMAGTGLESIRETIDLTNDAAKLGAESALILTPSFFDASMDSAALIDYFTQVADHSDIPVLLYNVPKFTHVTIGMDAVQKLMEHPNIAGMKDSSGNVPQLAAMKHVVPEEFNLMVGTAGAWYSALTLDIKAGVHALANCCPDECVKIQELFEAGDWKASRELYQRVLPVNSAVTGAFGIAGLKYGCDLMGYRGGWVRSPLQPLSEEKKAALRKIFEKAELI